jgi:hypothetical protein
VKPVELSEGEIDSTFEIGDGRLLDMMFKYRSRQDELK